MPGIDMKKCLACHTEKPLTEFFKSKRGKDGHYNQCKSCRIKNRAPRKDTAEQRRKWNLKSCFGITLEQYEQMLANQGGVCAICSYKPKGVLYVDHDHKTGKVRGLLCSWCNMALGLMKDSQSNLRRAADYLAGY